MADWTGGPAWLGMARRYGYRRGRLAGTQQAGSGVEALTSPGSGVWGGEQVGYSCCRLRGQSTPTPGQPCAGVYVCGDVNELRGWARDRSVCTIRQWRRGKAGVECRYASVKYPLRLAGAHMAGSGVGLPEACGLRRAPLRGHCRLGTWRERRAWRARGMRVRCVGLGLRAVLWRYPA